METKEVIAEIKSMVKPYHHVGMNQGTFSNTLKAIEFGYAKQTTIENFLKKFGYEKIPEKWEKKVA